MLNVLRDFDRRQLRLANLLQNSSWTHLLRTLLIAAVTLVLAYNFGRRPSWTYVLLPPIVVMLWIIFKNPWLGLMGMVVSAFVVPFGLGTGTGTSLNIVFLLIPVFLTLWLVDMIVIDRAITLAPSSTNLPLLGLILAISISFIIGYLPWNVFAQLAPLRAQIEINMVRPRQHKNQRDQQRHAHVLAK